MTTKISLSNSTVLAFDFAIKLMDGLLNVRPDYDLEGYPLVDMKFSSQYFTTEIMEFLRFGLEDYQLSRLEIEDSETDPDSFWSASERRKVTLFARPCESGKEVTIATFCVHREYLDDERAGGWTRWNVKNVTVCIYNQTVKLCTHIVNRYDEPLWGMSRSS